MNEMTLTGPQQHVMDYMKEHDEIEIGLLKQNGLDVRAANNLVKAGLLTLTGGVYRLPRRRRAESPAVVKEPAPEPMAAEGDAPASVPTAAEGDAPASAPTADAQGAAPAEGEAPASEPTTATEGAAPANDTSGPAKAAKGKAAGGKRTAARKAKAAKPEVNPTGKCLCGCNAELDPKRRFLIGHDAKLHSLVLRVFRGKADKRELPTSEASLDYLRAAPWMKDDIAKALGL